MINETMTAPLHKEERRIWSRRRDGGKGSMEKSRKYDGEEEAAIQKSMGSSEVLGSDILRSDYKTSTRQILIRNILIAISQPSQRNVEDCKVATSVSMKF